MNPTCRNPAWREEKTLLRLLNEHARTFALTLSLLPCELRKPLTKVYLLARASDTVADAERISRERRLLILEDLKTGLDLGSRMKDKCPFESFRWIRSGELSEPEERLIAAVPNIFKMVQEHGDRFELMRLWDTILEGQLFDLRRFSPDCGPLTREELEIYSGLVAGSVGATWTRLIVRHHPETLLLPHDEMIRLGTYYGMGLQLTNILRDRDADLGLGRVYAAMEELPELFKLAEAWLYEGRVYVSHLRGGRLRYASEIPLAIAERTLQRIRNFPEAPKVKISRARVYILLLRLIPSLVLPRGSNPAS